MAVSVGPRPDGGLSIESFRRSFFDSEAILRAMDRATAKALSRFGAFVRQRARTSIRYRQAPSASGQPPSAHRTMRRAKTSHRTGVTKVQTVSPLREFIFFAFERATETVVIGPALLNGARRNRSQTVPETLEYGGAMTVTEILRGHQWRQVFANLAAAPRGRPTRQRAVAIADRPFMIPAFQTELPQLTSIFADSF